MKKLLIVLAILACQNLAAADISQQEMSKTALKEAKKYRKEAWLEMPGAFPLEHQILAVLMKEQETGSDGMPKYVLITVIAEDTNLEIAKRKAMEMAKMRIASAIHTEGKGVVTGTVGDNCTEFSSFSSTKAFSRIGAVVPTMECWRKRSADSFEVMLTVLYETAQANKIYDEINVTKYE